MSEKEIDWYERETDNKSIDLNCVGVTAWFNPNDKRHIVIAGEKGKTKINRAQALALANELKGIVEMYMEDK